MADLIQLGKLGSVKDQVVTTFKGPNGAVIGGVLGVIAGVLIGVAISSK